MWWNKITMRRKAEVFGLLLVTISLFMLLSLATHSFTDDRWFATGDDDVWITEYRVSNSTGIFGGWVAFVFIELLGFSAVVMPVAGLIFGLRLLFNRRLRALTHRTFIAVAALFSIGVLVNLRPAADSIPFDHSTLTMSGTFGYAISGFLAGLFGVWGAGIFLIALLFGTAYLCLPWQRLVGRLSIPSIKRVNKPKTAQRSSSKKTPSETRWPEIWAGIKQKARRLGRVMMPEADTEPGAEETDDSQPEPDYIRSSTEHSPSPAPTEEKELEQPEEPAPASQTARKVKMVRPKRLEVGDFTYPPLDLLAESPARSNAQKKEIAENAQAGAEALRRALVTFDIRIADDIIDAFPGPVITRYEFKPAPGVKVNQIVNLADDLALVLRARRVRIIAPVPGKAAVGVEVPNHVAEGVYIREILHSDAYTSSPHRLPLALGKDISGAPFVVDLAAMPHLLIAGATGSGKSVCINVIITSLLYRLHPREIRFLFVDPKMLELSVYEGIPHLEKKVVSRPRGAERILEDCVREMEERYKKLAGAAVRNLTDYNTRADDESKLPYIVVVVDELADLMMSASANKIETLITRLAQMARAVGIHLVLATQRPSVDVITGLIKANFSSRIAFQVASKVDSRTIIDGNGAEKLLGRGDMLFLSPGTHEPVRLHGAYISGEETEQLVNFFKQQVVDTTKIDSFDEEAAKKRERELDPEDMVLRQAAEVVVRHKQGSVSLLQRRLGVGYQRAARLIDKLEQAGIVGPYDGSKAREVLVDKEALREKFGSSTPVEG